MEETPLKYPVPGWGNGFPVAPTPGILRGFAKASKSWPSPVRSISVLTIAAKELSMIMFRISLFASFLLGIAGIASAQILSGNPLAGLEKIKDFEAQRASSSAPDWKNDNCDARPINPGDTLTLAELEGPGVVAHFWCTIAHPAKYYSWLLTLRIYWDGEEHPSFECPIGDFFGIGHGVDRPLDSLPIRVSSLGRGRNCYWPMPFRKSARITVTNESDLLCHAFFFYLDWQKHPSLPEDSAYFHAMYRQEFPCVMGRNYPLADIEGRGHYVGTVQSVVSISNGWYGEGDDFFFIDGETEPRLRGTGTEDYFCDGWGFYPQQGLFYGAPLADWQNAGDMVSVYRFHIPDPIPFKKSLRVEIEHKGAQNFPDGNGSGFIERDDLMSSVAFWYQQEPHKRWPALPPGSQRLPFRENNIAVGWQTVPDAKHSDAPLVVQSIAGATENKQLHFIPADDKAWLEIPFHLERESIGILRLRACHASDYGIYRVLLDGNMVGKFDFYISGLDFIEKKLGWRELSPGNHTLRFECLGKNPDSTGYQIGIDSLILQSPVYTRSSKIDLHTLQKM
ncbi:MAG: DUF2961 domain-containing protein [Pirellulales bacterium]|nr:DUF2961 domain-containing protein [Pirellulales bacterium]